jgi:hypothetical protein
MNSLYGRIQESDILYSFKAELPNGSKLSMNAVWSGRMHWAVRSKVVHLHHKVAAKWLGGALKEKSVLKGQKRKKEVVYIQGTIQVNEPVELWYVWKFKTRPLDSGNCQAMSKGIEDGLVRCGLLGNDTNAFVTWVANISLPMTPDERDALEKDEVEVYILKSSVNDKR